MSKKFSFKFNSQLAYQLKAINAVVNLFNNAYSENIAFKQVSMYDEVVPNNLVIEEDILLKNLQEVQKQNSINLSERIVEKYFSVEMETGTGKTYVYLRTIFELNKKYNLKKFIIVVPSVAIREGVLKSLEVMRDHFKTLYNNLNYNYYIYNENKVRDFSTNNELQIMVINIQSFDKDINKIHQNLESFLGDKPIEYIKAVNPIIILDEPQSSSSTDKQKEAIKGLNPLFQIAYSATHKDLINPIFKLDAIEAYKQNLVKKIFVKSLTQDSNTNYNIKLLIASNKNNRITAKIEILNKAGKLIQVTVSNNDNLYYKSQNNSLYENGFEVSEINCSDEPFVEFANGTKIKKTNENDKDLEALQKSQIYETVDEHFDKQKKLLSKKIKVLSLFFIDKVANYKVEGKTIGKFAKMFEEAFLEISKKDKYKDVIKFNANEVHNGYFASDKKQGNKDTKGNTTDDNDVYSLIMKDKEKLLSFNDPTAFIFSHSALKEGWDNPNVFQICTLNETTSIMKKRQEIGRGLRLCVDEFGDRVHDNDINKLTVVTNSSYENFAKELQKEFIDEGISFGKIEYSAFYKIADEIEAKEIYNSLINNAYLTEKGEITDKFNINEKNFDLVIEDKFKNIKAEICDIIKSYLVKDNYIKSSKKIVTNKYHNSKDLSPYFFKIWDKIKYKAIYKVTFDNKELEDKCIEEINILPPLEIPKVRTDTVGIDINKAGIESNIISQKSKDFISSEFYCYNIVEEIIENTGLTKASTNNILLNITNLGDFFKQPHKYINNICKTINEKKIEVMIGGLKYEKTQDIYSCDITDKQDVFQELSNYYEIVNSKKSVSIYIDTDSEVEKSFAKELDTNEDVLFFFKLNKSFTIDTPLGTYNPDWAVIKKENHNDNTKTLYFIAETKGLTDTNRLRPQEKFKIECGEKHFAVVDTEIKFKVVKSLSDDFN